MTSIRTNTFLVFYTKDGGKDVIKGNNSDRQLRSGCKYGIHAEMDVLRKLFKIKYKYRYINLLVIRIDKGGNLKNSKPCAKCIQYMNYVSRITPYIIQYVYWSNGEGMIIKSTLSDLNYDSNKHVSKRFRNIH